MSVMSMQSAPRQVCMGSNEPFLHKHVDSERFFARGPTTPCPILKCPAVVCSCFLRHPVAWLSFPCRFRCSPTMLNPWAAKPARLASLFKNIQGLAEAAPPDIVTMQMVTDMPVAMPCLGCCCHQVLGKGVDLSPASPDVMPKGLHSFAERGLWLFPKGQGREEMSSCGRGKDICRRGSFCCCCCVGGLGGCDGTLLPPLPSVNPKVILYIHGGAFALTNAESYPWLLGYELVRRTGAVVLVPDYTRPPDTSYGVAGSPLEDCLQLYKTLLSLYGPEGVLVMGDSAGGNIALSLVLAATQEGLPPPAGLVLISPWVDLTEASSTHESRITNRDHDYLPEKLVRLFAQSYCKHDCTDPLVSPTFAPHDWLALLPPTMITYGSHEVLRSQQQELQRLLGEAGVLKAVYVAHEMPHVSPLFASVIWGPGTAAVAPLHPAVEALQRIQEFASSRGFKSQLTV